MGTKIGWVPYEPKNMEFIYCTDWNACSLETAFGTLPVRLSMSEIPVLLGMSACGFSGADELIKAIDTFKTITLMKKE